MTETGFESKTPYDDVCRTLLSECDDLVIPLINEIFGGIFEYAAQIALDDGEVGTSVSQGTHTKQVILRLTLPNSALICLRSKKNTAGQWRIHLQTPGGECRYEVPVMHVRDYTTEELFAKKLYFLIPFYIFNLETELPSINEEEWKLEDLKHLYEKILEKLSELEEKGEITSFSFETLKDMTKRVAYHLAEKLEQVKKGIGEVMGGEVLDFEAKRIRDAARLEGRAEGRMEGRMEGKTEGEDLKLIKQVYIKRKKGQKPEVIAEALEEQVSYIKKICTVIEEINPEFDAEFDAEQVYHKMKM